LLYFFQATAEVFVKVKNNVMTVLLEVLAVKTDNKFSKT